MVKYKKPYQRKMKVCVECGCDAYIFSKGRCKNCAKKEYASTVQRNKRKRWTSADLEKLKEKGKVGTISNKDKKSIKGKESEFAKVLAAATRSKKSISQFLMDALDRVASIHTRIKLANENGMVQCVVSKKWFHWKNLDCGHFMTRNHMATRWDTDNIWPQSRHSNSFAGGEQFEMGQFINEFLGEGEADRITKKAKTEKGPDTVDKINLLIWFRAENKRIAKEKQLQL